MAIVASPHPPPVDGEKEVKLYLEHSRFTFPFTIHDSRLPIADRRFNISEIH